MARDRPSPYGGRDLFSGVARGPVPRDRAARDKVYSPKEMFCRAKTKHASRPGGLAYPKETFRRDTFLILKIVIIL